MSEAFPMPAQPSALKKLLTNKLNISALGVFIVFLLCVGYILLFVVQKPIPLLQSSAKSINVDLSQTGGLYVGAPVAYRGVTIGQISKMDLTDRGCQAPGTTCVRATAAIRPGNDVPRDAVAKVRSLSPVGEQYLDFEPNSASGPFLKDGDTIPGTATIVPETLAGTVISINKLLDQLNPEQLHTVLDESSAALAGTSKQLGQLADQGSLLVNDLNTYWPNINNILHNVAPTLDTISSNGPAIVQSAKDFQAFASFLKDYSPELATLLKNAPATIAQIQSIINDVQTVAPQFVMLGHQVSGLLASYNPHLGTLLSVFSPSLNAVLGTLSNGNLQFSLIGQHDDQCVYNTQQLNPALVSNRPLQTGGFCPGSVPFLQRGAAHAPGPVPAQ